METVWPVVSSRLICRVKYVTSVACTFIPPDKWSSLDLWHTKKSYWRKKNSEHRRKKKTKKKSNTKRANVLVEQCSRPSKVSTKNITSIHDNIYFVVSYFLFCHLISSKMNIFVYAIIPHIFSFWMQTFLFLAQSRQLTCILYCYESCILYC